MVRHPSSIHLFLSPPLSPSLSLTPSLHLSPSLPLSLSLALYLSLSLSPSLLLSFSHSLPRSLAPSPPLPECFHDDMRNVSAARAALPQTSECCRHASMRLSDKAHACSFGHFANAPLPKARYAAVTRGLERSSGCRTLAGPRSRREASSGTNTSGGRKDDPTRHSRVYCNIVHEMLLFIYIYIYIYTDKPLQSAPSPLLFLFLVTGSRTSADAVGPTRKFPLAKRWGPVGPILGSSFSPVPCAQVSIGKNKTRTTLYVWHQSFAPVG